MKAGNFNINDYLNKLNENTEGNLKGDPIAAMIPDESKKSFSWLKKEYDKDKVEVKVEIKMGGTKFEPGYEMQTDIKSVKDFKPGMYGDVETSDTPGSKKGDKDTAQTTAEKEGKKPEAEKKAEASTGDKGGESKISAKVKTADDTEKKEEKEEKKDKKEEKEDDKT